MWGGRVCHIQFLLALASAVILGSESLGTRDHILLSQIRDFPFSSPSTTRRVMVEVFDPSTRDSNSSCVTSPLYSLGTAPTENTASSVVTV
jgi:hypothetical protein